MAIERNDTAADEERLNELYWNSSRTVDEIVAELSMGRNTLYASIQPLPAGFACSSCGGEIVFANRTGRAAGTGQCLDCLLEVDVSSIEVPQVSMNGARPAEKPWEQWREDSSAVVPERLAMIGGAAALGVLLGVAVAKTLRSRSILS